MGLADKSRASKNAVLLYLTALTNPMNSNEVVTSILNIASVILRRLTRPGPR